MDSGILSGCVSSLAGQAMDPLLGGSHGSIKTFWHRGRAWIRVYALARFWMFDITNIATYALHQLTDILFLYKRIQN